jgi:hypothetical protein
VSALAEFFAHAPAWLDGSIDAEQFAARLGPTPSGTSRLALYPKLVRAQHLQAMHTLFPALERALEAHASGCWALLVDDYLAAQPCRHWNPTRLGAGFLDHLHSAASRGAAPAWAAELADLHLTELHVTIELRNFDPRRDAVNPALAVREYTHDVLPCFASTKPHVPEPRPVRLFVVRRFEHERARFLSATPAQLCALGVATGEAAREQIARAGLPLAELRSAVRELGRARVLGQSAVSNVLGETETT